MLTLHNRATIDFNISSKRSVWVAIFRGFDDRAPAIKEPTRWRVELIVQWTNPTIFESVTHEN